MDAALEKIQLIAWVPKEGDVVRAKVVNQLAYGWF